MATPSPSLQTRINAAFDRYEATLELAETLFAEQVHPVGIVLLVCSRLDALSNLANTRGTAGERFGRFVVSFGDRGDALEAISVGDLYAYIARGFVRLPAILETAGRLEFFGSTSLPFLRFLADSGLPLTSDAVSALPAQMVRGYPSPVLDDGHTVASQANSGDSGGPDATC